MSSLTLIDTPVQSEGNPRSLAGSGEGGAPASLASWGLALDVPPARGTLGELVVGGGEFSLRLGCAWPWGWRGCRSGGSGLRLRRVASRWWSVDFGRLGVLVFGSCGVQPWGWRGCRSGGSGCFASAVCVEVSSAVLRRGWLVSALVARASWSSTRVECGFGVGGDVGAAAPDCHLRHVVLGFGVRPWLLG